MKKQFKQPTLTRHLDGTCTFEVLFFFKCLSFCSAWFLSLIKWQRDSTLSLNPLILRTFCPSRSINISLSARFSRSVSSRRTAWLSLRFILSEFVILDILIEKIYQQTLHFVTSLTNKLRRGEKKWHSDAENPAIMQIQIEIMWQALAWKSYDHTHTYTICSDNFFKSSRCKSKETKCKRFLSLILMNNTKTRCVANFLWTL